MELVHTYTYTMTQIRKRIVASLIRISIKKKLILCFYCTEFLCDFEYQRSEVVLKDTSLYFHGKVN